jgi:hypothetical protein
LPGKKEEKSLVGCVDLMSACIMWLNVGKQVVLFSFCLANLYVYIDGMNFGMDGYRR